MIVLSADRKILIPDDTYINRLGVQSGLRWQNIMGIMAPRKNPTPSRAESRLRSSTLRIQVSFFMYPREEIRIVFQIEY
jgi:hypothetical protein